ncbi:MAG: SUF system NifU family Fe-S cluster assembly protein [Rothia sp. (in: high G+C Gram-positive bacteria)]|nr:SUF system NifU family Fe-S cluster assembly protein [Rothia sp. (in: high G+C Gram-positive bacteria)]
MNGLESLYQQIILDHSKERHGEGLILPQHRSAQNHQYNPTCGDEINLRVELNADADRIEQISWEGDGCSISMAAASVLSQLGQGMQIKEFMRLIEEFRRLLRSRGQLEPDEELLGDAAAFAGVSRFVARVKCAMLAWVAAEKASEQLLEQE